MNTRQKILSVVTLSSAAVLTGSLVIASAPQGVVPSNWYSMPEDVPANAGSAIEAEQLAQDAAPATDDVGPLVDRIYQTNANALEKVGTRSGASALAQGNLPSDWTPWHLEYFTTDLTVSSSGGIGVVTVKGSPAVQAFWRRQGVAKPSSPQTLLEKQEDSGAVAISPDTTPPELHRELEPAIKAVMATGKVKDEDRLRSELKTKASLFQRIASGIAASDTGSSTYWVSGFRMDLIIDMTGQVGFGTLGAETRLRFEWKRAMRKSTTPHQSAVVLASTEDRTVQSVQQFATSIASDLEEVASDSPLAIDFQPYAFRVSLGMIASGDCGFAKGTGTLLGHINFARNQTKPVVHPIRSAEASNYLVIENAPKASHVEFAKALGIPTQVMNVTNGNDTLTQASYLIDRAHFKKGIQKAMKMASFFAQRGSKANADSPHWKVYVLLAGFDMSVTGSVGLVSLGGQATTEINFYNEKF